MLHMLQGEGKGQARSKSPQDVVRELYAGIDLPKLVQRMLVVMHEVTPACNLKVFFFGNVPRRAFLIKRSRVFFYCHFVRLFVQKKHYDKITSEHALSCFVCHLYALSFFFFSPLLVA